MAVSLSTGRFAPTPVSSAVATTDSGAGTLGAWTEVISATPADWYVAGSIFGAVNETDLQIGVGAAGSEVVLGTLRSGGDSGGRFFYAPFPIPVGPVPAGSRLAVRSNVSLAQVVLCYMDGYVPEALGTAVDYTTTPLAGVPSGSARVDGVSVAVGTGSAWQNNAWSELTTGFSADVAIYGLSRTERSTAEHEWEIGLGASGSETVAATVRTWSTTGPVNRNVLNLPVPIFVAAGTRVAVRVRRSVTTAYSGSYEVTLLYYDAFTTTDATAVALWTPLSDLTTYRESPTCRPM